MKLKIDQKDFDFDGFLDAMVEFIESNFGTEKPDAADTLRYFYSFIQPTDIKNTIFPDKDPFGLEDFKTAIIKGGESIFFPFSSGLLMDGSVNLATDEIVRLPKTESTTIGMTDCLGALVKLEKSFFIIRVGIAWGGQNHEIEFHSLPKIDKKMNAFLNSFVKKAED